MTKFERKGPRFEIASDQAIIALGNSARWATGVAAATALDETGLFPRDIDIVTTNQLDAMIGRRGLRQALAASTVVAHSAALMYIPKALQVVAFNAPEQTTGLIKNAMKIGEDPVRKDHDAHKTGPLDLMAAGIELLRSPITSIRTQRKITGGYSATTRLINGANDFPEGRAMVHAELDGFGFADLAYMDRAARNGVGTVMMPDAYHNEFMFAPRQTLIPALEALTAEQVQLLPE